MSAAADAKQDRPASLTVPRRAESVEALPGFVLKVSFPDGTNGHVRMVGLIQDPNAGVFAALRDPELFAQAYLEHGAVTWPGELDLAPDAMYDEIKAKGEWIL